ncbi:MAG: hypothetical protein V4712_15110 [Pseudomonadota bacterium]
MTGLILPPKMTAQERRGFRIACACFATMGRQMAREPSVAGPDQQHLITDAVRGQALMLMTVAAALDRTLGRSG